MSRLRRHRKQIGVLAAIAAAAIAVAVGSASATTVLAGNLRIVLNGATTPKALPKDKMAPIGFHGSLSIATIDGTHVPPVTFSHLQIDKHIGIDTTGLRNCKPQQLTNTVPSQAMKTCRSALIGQGSSTAQVQFPGSPPFLAKGPLLVFNGPSIGGGYGGHGYPEQIYYVYAHVPRLADS